MFCRKRQNRLHVESSWGYWTTHRHMHASHDCKSRAISTAGVQQKNKIRGKIVYHLSWYIVDACNCFANSGMTSLTASSPSNSASSMARLCASGCTPRSKAVFPRHTKQCTTTQGQIGTALSSYATRRVKKPSSGWLMHFGCRSRVKFRVQTEVRQFFS